MTEYTNKGATIRGEKLVFQGRKVDKPQLFRKSGKHRGQRVRLYDGICWIEVPIKLRKSS